jgi:hypothetical protein
MMHRPLARDYETLAASSEAMIHAASIKNLAKRTTDETAPTRRGTYWYISGNSPTLNALSEGDGKRCLFVTFGNSGEGCSISPLC